MKMPKVVRQAPGPRPSGYGYDIQERTVLMPKTHVLVRPPEKIRVREDGKTELFERISFDGSEPPAEDTWVLVPDTAVVVPEGQQLTFEQMDIVRQVVAVRFDLSILGPDGNARAVAIPIGERMRMDLTRFQKLFERDEKLVTA